MFCKQHHKDAFDYVKCFTTVFTTIFRVFCGIILACCATGTIIEICQETFEQNEKEREYFAKENDAVKLRNGEVESSFGHEVPANIAVRETTPLIRANKKNSGR